MRVRQQSTLINNVDTGIDVNASLSGNDAGDFTCTASNTAYTLSFSTAPNFEAPADADSNNVYEVAVTISDGTNSGSTISYTVTVDDVAMAITQSQTGPVSEAATSGTTVMTVSTSGDSAESFSITSGNSDGIFALSNAGVITIASTTNLDYESKTSYTLSITGVSGSSSDTEDLTISISDANDQTPTYSATDANPDVTEGTTAVDTNVAITDTDTGDSNSCTLGGSDSGSFTCVVDSSYSCILSRRTSKQPLLTATTFTVTVTINDGAQNGLQSPTLSRNEH